MSSCTLYAQIIDNNGMLVDSQLHKGLTLLTTRKNASSIYNHIKRESIDNLNGLEKDDLGEPTLGSVISNYNLSKVGITKSILEAKAIELTKKENNGNLSGEYTYKEVVDKFKEAKDKFNKESPLNSVFLYTYAEVNKEDGSKYYYPKIIVKSSIYSRTLSPIEKQAKANEELNNRLTELLTSWGISIGELNELDKKLHLNGVTEFNLANTKADGFIELIRLANNEEGRKALPEEFAHVALRLAKDSPLVQRLLHLASNGEIIKEVLGESYNDYIKLYEGNNDLLAEEVAGKLLAKYLNNNYTPSNISKSFIRRVLDAILEFFKGKNTKNINNIRDAIQQEYSEAANRILSGKFSNIIRFDKSAFTFEKLANLESLVKTKHDIAKNILDNLYKKLAIYESRKNSGRHTEAMNSLINSMETLIDINSDTLAITKFLTSAISEVKALEEKYKKIKEDIPLNYKAKILRDINQFIAFYRTTTADLRVLKSEDRELDPDLVAALDKLLLYISDLEQTSTKYSIPILMEFLQPFYEDINMDNPFSDIDTDSIPPLEKLLQYANRDISTAELWIDSIAQGTDDALKLLDQVVKKAKHTARLDTIDIKNRVYEATFNLEQAGFKDQSFMFEVDNEGNKTGYYIEKESYSYAILHPAQKAFYNEIISIKEALEGHLPEKYRESLRTIKIRKDFLERVTSDGKVIEGFWDKIKSMTIQRTGEDAYGNKSTLIDFEGRQVQNLPIYYIFTKEGESENDITEDVSPSLIAYASMASEFKEMNKVIHLLELGRDILRKRKVQVTQGGVPLVSKFMGKETWVEVIQEQGTNLQKRSDIFYSMQVYDEYTKDEGVIAGTNIDKAKLANLVMKMTAINSLSFNMLSAISNLTQGAISTEIEVASSRYFSRKDITKADIEYSRLLVPHLANMGDRVKTDFLSLFLDKFDVLQDFEERDKQAKMNRRNLFSKMFGSDLLFVFQNAPEHWIQTRNSLALAYAYNMLDLNGNKVSLMDALEIVYIDPANPKKGATLEIKEGYTKEDGSNFNTKDVIDFTLKSAAVNQRLNGIYNKLDSNAMQYTALLRMAFMFRKWMPAYWNRRYQRNTYNHDLKDWTEGYYITTGKFAKKLYKALKEGNLNIAKEWHNLTDAQKANIRAAIKEISIFMLLLGLVSLVDWDDDKKERTYWSYLLEHQMRRTYMEVGAFMPTTSMISEGFKLLKSPSATLTPIQSTIDLFGLFNYNNYEAFVGEDALIKSGRFKGHSKAERLIWKSPLIPMSNTLYKNLYPEETITYYK